MCKLISTTEYIYIFLCLQILTVFISQFLRREVRIVRFELAIVSKKK